MASGLRADLRSALARAIKARDPVAASALRSALAAVENAEAIDAATVPKAGAGDARVAGSLVGLGAGEAERRPLTAAEVEAIVRAEVTERRAAALEYRRLGRPEHADRLLAEAAVLERHLPGSS
jgi:uncharacterized protein YqeY